MRARLLRTKMMKRDIGEIKRSLANDAEIKRQNKALNKVDVYTEAKLYSFEIVVEIF